MYSSRACALGVDLSLRRGRGYMRCRFGLIHIEEGEKEKKNRLGVSVRMLFRDGLEGSAGRPSAYLLSPAQSFSRSGTEIFPVCRAL